MSTESCELHYTALTTPTTAFVTDWTRLACRLSPTIHSIRWPARLTVITFRFMPDYDDLHLSELPALNEGISQDSNTSVSMTSSLPKDITVMRSSPGRISMKHDGTPSVSEVAPHYDPLLIQSPRR